MKDEAPLGSPFIGEPRCGWGGGAVHVAKNSLICPQGAVVEIKSNIVEGNEGKSGGRWPSSHKSLTGRPHLPPLNSHFHFSPHLIPLMLTPLTKSIKSKTNSLHLFPMFYLFHFDFFRFYDMQ
jgi:hypothetical protein